MIRNMFRIMGLGLALVFVCAAVCADGLSPEQMVSARRQLNRLASEDLATREDAVDKLIELGPAVLPTVKRAGAASEFEGTREGCWMVVMGLLPTDKASFGASQVTLEQRDIPLDRALEALAEQSGNMPLSAGQFADRRVTVSVKDVPYWAALDAIAHSAGLRWSHDAMGLVDAKNAAGARVAWAGPTAVRVDGVERLPRENRWVVHVVSEVEERLMTPWCELRFAEVAGVDGKNLLKGESRTVAEGMNAVRWMGNRLDVSVSDDGTARTVSMKGEVVLKYPVGRKELKIDDALGGIGGKKRSATDDGLKVTVVKGEKIGSRARLTVRVEVDKDKGFAYCRDFTPGYGFALVDTEGKRHTWGKCVGRDDNEVSMDLNELPEDPAVWTLVYTYPKEIKEFRYPFVIPDVELK